MPEQDQFKDVIQQRYSNGAQHFYGVDENGKKHHISRDLVVTDLGHDSDALAETAESIENGQKISVGIGSTAIESSVVIEKVDEVEDAEDPEPVSWPAPTLSQAQAEVGEESDPIMQRVNAIWPAPQALNSWAAPASPSVATRESEAPSTGDEPGDFVQLSLLQEEFLSGAWREQPDDNENALNAPELTGAQVQALIRAWAGSSVVAPLAPPVPVSLDAMNFNSDSDVDPITDNPFILPPQGNAIPGPLVMDVPSTSGDSTNSTDTDSIDFKSFRFAKEDDNPIRKRVLKWFGGAVVATVCGGVLSLAVFSLGGENDQEPTDKDKTELSGTFVSDDYTVESDSSTSTVAPVGINIEEDLEDVDLEELEFGVVIEDSEDS